MGRGSSQGYKLHPGNLSFKPAIRPHDFVTDMQNSIAQRQMCFLIQGAVCIRGLSLEEKIAWYGVQVQFQMNRNRLAESWLGSRIHVSTDRPTGSSKARAAADCVCCQSEYSLLLAMLKSICQHDCSRKRESLHLPTPRRRRAAHRPQTGGKAGPHG